MEFIGVLLKKLEQREGVGAHGKWQIASYLLATVEASPRYLAVDVSNTEFNNRIGQFDAMVGKNVKVAFEISAREYQGKWYNGVRAFGIREVERAAADAASTVAQTEATKAAADAASTVAANGTQNNGGAEMTGQPDGNVAGTAAMDDSPFPPQEGSINCEMMGK
jgi:hypothetical protein